MNYFEEALTDRRSTILYGSFGRYPHIVQNYLNLIQDLESASKYEPIFWYRKKRLLYIIIEPAFDETIPSHQWNLVLTSHLRLSYDPLRTRIVDSHFSLERIIPYPIESFADQAIVVPPTSHHPNTPFLSESSRIDLKDVEDAHEAYLRLLCLYDILRPSSEWSLSIRVKLKQDLLKDIPKTGPYDSHLRKVLENEC